MTKSELIKMVAAQADVADSTAKAVVEAVVTQVTETLVQGGAVTLAGFGTFSVKPRTARIGRNPQNGQEIQIPASNRAMFKPGKALKDAIQ